MNLSTYVKFFLFLTIAPFHLAHLFCTLQCSAVFDASVIFPSLLCLQFYLQDTKSSNGTFINSQRLSRGSEESPPCEVLSGDIIQFGVDVTENTRKGEESLFVLVAIVKRGTTVCLSVMQAWRCTYKYSFIYSFIKMHLVLDEC